MYILCCVLWWLLMFSERLSAGDEAAASYLISFIIWNGLIELISFHFYFATICPQHLPASLSGFSATLWVFFFRWDWQKAARSKPRIYLVVIKKEINFKLSFDFGAFTSSRGLFILTVRHHISFIWSHWTSLTDVRCPCLFGFQALPELLNLKLDIAVLSENQLFPVVAATQMLTSTICIKTCCQ